MEEKKDMVFSIVENLITGVCAFELNKGRLTPVYTNEGMRRMLGYSQKEMERYLKNVRFSIIPEDLPVFEQGISDTLKADGPVDCEFRTVTGKGSLRWLMVRSNLYSKQGDTYVIVCVIIDVTERKTAEEELKLQAERLNLLTQTDRERILDYNAKTDVMTIRFPKKNGMNNEKILPNYIEHFQMSSFHPEDIEMFLEVFKGLLVSPKSEVFEVRNKRYDEDYVWYQMNLTSIAGVEGYVTRIVGRMVNIHETKMRELQLTTLANTDGLTQIYNRNAVETNIKDFLEQEKESGQLHAFMIIDLDNFKSVNDCLGHSTGDRILQECADIIMKSFRRIDVIGRVGGDEFVVLAKDIGTISNADILATKLVEQLNWKLPYQDTMIPVSGSIGISVFPYHGVAYKELFDRADKALYSVKANGKSGYQIYDSANTRAYHISRREDDERDEQEYREGEILEDMVMHVLYEDKVEHSALNSVLEMIIQKMCWQRAYICPPVKQVEEHTRFVKACQDGFEFGTKSLEKKQELAGFCEELHKENNQMRVLNIYDNLSETLHRYMLEEKIKRILYYPFDENGEYRGAVVFEDHIGQDDAEQDMAKQEEMASVLRLLDACAIQFRIGKDRVRDLITQLGMIDNMDTYIYLVDADTYKLKFFNKKVMKDNPEIKLGGYCYEMIKQQDHPCEDCIMCKLNRNDFHASCSGEIFNNSLRTWTRQNVCWFECNKEKAVCMINEMDISEYFIG